MSETPALPPELNPRGSGRSRQPRSPRPARSGSGTGGQGGGRLGVFIVSGVAAVAVLAYSVVGTGLANYFTSKAHVIDVIGGTAPSVSAAQNWLIVGSDSRAGLTPLQISQMHVGAATATNAGGRRTDTMILMHLYAGQSKATLISLPRDSYVTIPAYIDSSGVHHAAEKNKINAAYGEGGPKLAIETVELATGLHIDHYIEIGFDGFVKMVDALGGVNVCATKAVSDPKSGLNLKAGTTSLNGIEALKYVRARYIDPTADLGRMKRQQAFIGSMLRKALSSQTLFNPLKISSFLNAAMSSVVMDSQLTRDDLLHLALSTHGLSASQVVFATVPLSNVNYMSPNAGSSVLWDPVNAPKLFAALKADQPIGSQVATPAATASHAPTVSASVAPSAITVQVLNGSTVSGLGGRATADLTRLGYVSAGPAGNAQVTGVTQTIIKYDPGWNVSVKTLEAAFPDARLQASPGQGKVFQIIVGTGYKAPQAVTISPSASGSSTSNPGGVQTTSAADVVCQV